MTTVDQQYWQISAAGPGEKVEALDDIAQSIQLILLTIPGSDPLRPDFGCDWTRYLDRPDFAALFQKEVISAIKAWETRAELTSVDVSQSESNVTAFVNWKLAGSSITGDTSITFNTSNYTAVEPASLPGYTSSETTIQLATEYWQISPRFGVPVQGVDEISQSMLNVLLTYPGSDILRPDFGSGIYEHIAAPINIAAPLMAAAIKTDITRWEPRVKVIDVTYLLQEQPEDEPGSYSRVVFSVTWRLPASLIQGQTDLILQLDAAGEDIDETTIFIRILATEIGELLQTETGNRLIRV